MPMDIKLATWNINSVRLRQDQVVDFLKAEQPDILGLQEIKCLEELFPFEPFRALGYDHIEVSGQKGYHGVATLSKYPLKRMDTQFCPLGHARHVSTEVMLDSQNFEFHNFYIPAGGDVADPEVNDKFAHKLEFLDNMRQYFTMRAAQNDSENPNRLVLAGDFNIAPHENDVWSHKQLLKVVSHTPLEVETLDILQQSHDFTDCSRLFAADEDKLFSWWSYRGREPMKSNRGRRLDHIWVSPALLPAVKKTGASGHEIHVPCRTWHEKPSDHVPLTQRFSFDTN